MDVQLEIQKVLTLIEEQEQIIDDRKNQIIQLEQELEDAKMEKQEFIDESAQKDDRIAELED